MEKQYKVSMVTDSAKEAFAVLETLPRPIYVFVYSNRGEIQTPMYKDIVKEIKRIVPAMIESSLVEFASKKFEEGENVILKFTPQTGGSSGDLHKVITELRLKNSHGSLFGVCIDSRATTPVKYGTDASGRPPFNCTISIK